jgi:hypothetical protein
MIGSLKMGAAVPVKLVIVFAAVVENVPITFRRKRIGEL